MCKGEKQVYVQRLAHINQGSLLQTILTVGNKWGAFLKKKIGYTVHIYVLARCEKNGLVILYR